MSRWQRDWVRRQALWVRRAEEEGTPIWIYKAARQVTRNWAAPILWGALNGYGAEAIAEGLDLEPALVKAVIARFAPWRSPETALSGIDPERYERDWAYRNWARARHGASIQLALGARA